MMTLPRRCRRSPGTGTRFRNSGEVAERIYALEKQFNVREGLGREVDTLPERFLAEPIPDGPRQGFVIPREQLDRMLDEYYEIRGWDRQTGIPAPAVTDKLGIGS